MIIIDATSVCDRISGIERYTIETSYRIAQLANSQGLPTTLALAKNSLYPEDKVQLFNQCLRSPFSSRLLTEQIWLPRLIGRFSSAFYPAFPPGFLTYRLSRNTRISHTVHDAVMWKRSHTLSFKNKLYMRPLENYGLERYSAIETVSEFSKSEISSIFPTLSRKIHVSGNGVVIFPHDVSRFVGEPYLLFVGTIEPRKNLPFLVKIFKKIREIRPELKLVIAGRKGWGIAELEIAITQHLLEEHVVILGAVSEEQLASLYSHAEIFVYPSIYEGFGLPVVEAMAAGLPVVSSNGGALPEAIGSGGLVIPLTDEAAWIASILKLLDHPEHRGELIAKGKSHISNFSWDVVSEKIYSRLASNPCKIK